MTPSTTNHRTQITGNSGIFHVARELSRNGWSVMLTVRNARGADLYAANDDELIVHPIQSKALSKPDPVPLGASLEKLKSPWWVITVNANSEQPTSYVLTLAEVKSFAVKRTNKEGKSSFWLQRPKFEQPLFKDAWHRLGLAKGVSP